MMGLVEEQFIRFRILTFAELKKRLETMFKKDVAATILFETGRACGKRSALRAEEESKKSGKSLLEQIRKIKKDENWCKVDFDGFDVGQRAGVVTINDSFEGLSYGMAFGSSKEPICHFLRGYFSGALSHVCGADVVLSETKCIAKGDSYCEFQVVTIDVLGKNTPGGRYPWIQTP